jgi:phosphatidate cytidylyltransferase
VGQTPPAASPASADAASRSRRSKDRAGRNLPAAVAVGVTLGAVALASLFFDKRLFLVLATAAVLGAVWELAGAVRTAGIALPTPPLYPGVVLAIAAAFWAGPGGLVVALTLTAVAVLVWRGLVAPGSLGPQGYRRDVTAGLFSVVYLLTAGGFAALLVRPEDGPFRILAWLLLVVGSDVGGYTVGVLTGRHPMAPSVSPKKSWEGFGGSVLACVLLGVLVVWLALDAAWWVGVVLGVSMALSATLGDLTESLLKRDIGVKDMGTLLPGHGGLMDRLDSIALSAPVAWLVLGLLVPVA